MNENREAMIVAYGKLWRDTPSSTIASEARRVLRDCLTEPERQRGIEMAIDAHGPTTEQEILSIDFTDYDGTNIRPEPSVMIEPKDSVGNTDTPEVFAEGRKEYLARISALEATIDKLITALEEATDKLGDCYLRFEHEHMCEQNDDLWFEKLHDQVTANRALIKQTRGK